MQKKIPQSQNFNKSWDKLYKSMLQANFVTSDNVDCAIVRREIAIAIFSFCRKHYWSDATAKQLQEKDRLENILSKLIDTGIINSLENLIITIKENKYDFVGQMD